MQQIASQRTSITKIFAEMHAFETHQKCAPFAVLNGANSAHIATVHYISRYPLSQNPPSAPGSIQLDSFISYYMVVARKQSLRVFIFTFVNFEGDKSISLQSCEALIFSFFFFFLNIVNVLVYSAQGIWANAFSRFCRKISKKMSLNLLAFFAFCC